MIWTLADLTPQNFLVRAISLLVLASVMPGFTALRLCPTLLQATIMFSCEMLTRSGDVWKTSAPTGVLASHHIEICSCDTYIYTRLTSNSPP